MNIHVLASGSDGNCYLIANDFHLLMIEAGIGFADMQQRTGFRLSHLDACLVSHEHFDHAKQAGMLMLYGVECYMSKATAERLEPKDAWPKPYRLHYMDAPKQVSIADYWKVKPFDVVHDVPTLGFLIETPDGERLLYATDTAYIKYRFENLTRIMLEANYSEEMLRENVRDGAIDRFVKNRVYGSHMSIERVLDMLRANDLSQVKQIVLLHLSDTNSDAEGFKRQVEAATGKPVTIA